MRVSSTSRRVKQKPYVYRAPFAYVPRRRQFIGSLPGAAPPAAVTRFYAQLV